jgi:uncharacterized membrane protein YwaF
MGITVPKSRWEKLTAFIAWKFAMNKSRLTRLKVFVVFYVLRRLAECKFNTRAASATWRERFPEHACNLMICGVSSIVHYIINTRSLDFVSRFEGFRIHIV